MTNEMFASIFSIQFVFGVLQAITLSIATRCNRRANLTMAAFVVLCTILSFDCYLHFTGRLELTPYFIRFFTPFYTLIGIIPFLYTKCLTEKDFKYDLKTFFYFIPFILVLVAYVPVYFYSAEQKLEYISENQDMIYRFVIFLLTSLSNITFIFFSYSRLRTYHRAVKNFYSNLSALQFRWLEVLFLIIGILLTATLFLSILMANGNFKIVYMFMMMSFFLLSLFMAFSAMTKVDSLFHLIDDFKTEINEDRKKKRIPDNIYYKLVDSIAGLIDNKIYTDPDLKMSTLAKKTGHPAYLVSLFINKHYGMTFFELINLHRVEEAKKRLIDTQYRHLTILAISQDVGFSSKSAFNSTFKKITGTTPSEFKGANS